MIPGGDPVDYEGARGVVTCQECGQEHEATYSHMGRWDRRPVFAVVCPVDDLTDFYTDLVVTITSGGSYDRD